MKKFANFVAFGFCVYMIGFGVLVILHPATVESFGLDMVRQAGITEIRVFYGALSLAVGLCFAALLKRGQVVDCLKGALTIAGCVCLTRLAGTAVDGGWHDAYTHLAIPCETCFVAVLAAGLWAAGRGGSAV